MRKKKPYVCFSAGIGELAIKATGYSILTSNELLQSRCDLYRENFPEVENIFGDIWEKENEIISAWKSKTSSIPFLIYAIPPRIISFVSKISALSAKLIFLFTT